MAATLVGIARKAKPGAPVEELQSTAVTVSAGIEGDARGTAKDRNVTVMSRDSWAAALAELGQPDLPWITRRANLLVDGLDWPPAIGAVLKIGEVELQVTDECEPCSRMDRELQGLRKALGPDWRGGATCRVLSAGQIAVGASVGIV